MILILELFDENKKFLNLCLVVADKLEIFVDFFAESGYIITAVSNVDYFFELHEFGFIKIAVLAILAYDGVDVLYYEFSLSHVVVVSLRVSL